MVQRLPCSRRSFQRLDRWPALTGVATYDAVPPNATGTFVLIGPEEARDQSDKSGAGAEHQMVISVITDATGFPVDQDHRCRHLGRDDRCAA